MSPGAEQQNLTLDLLWGVGAAVTTLLLLAAIAQLGVPGVLLNLFVAVPAAYVHMRFSTVAAVSAVGLVLAGEYLLAGPGGVAGYLLQFGIMSILLPLLMRRGLSWGRSAVLTIAVVSLCGLGLLASYANSAGSSVTEVVSGYAASEADQAMEIYKASDLTPEQLETLRESVDEMAGFIVYTYPGLAVSVVGLLALLMLGILQVISKGRYEIPGPVFARWKSPELLVWPLIGAGFMFAMGEDAWRQIGANLLIVMLPIYFLQGLAIITYFFNKRRTPPLLRGLGYVLLTLFNPLPLIVAGIGVFDLWVDFRKPRIKET
ncbi:MAG: hypothetical protein C0615_09270 [Desulfuromonas sp.]|nr:MAG: hypothetical protein C0615_09270 [Desulfuromonas sp.]